MPKDENDIFEEKAIELTEKEDIMNALTFLLGDLKSISLVMIRNGSIASGDGSEPLDVSFWSIVKNGSVDVEG